MKCTHCGRVTYLSGRERCIYCGFPLKKTHLTEAEAEILDLWELECSNPHEKTMSDIVVSSILYRKRSIEAENKTHHIEGYYNVGGNAVLKTGFIDGTEQEAQRNDVGFLNTKSRPFNMSAMERFVDSGLRDYGFFDVYVKVYHNYHTVQRYIQHKRLLGGPYTEIINVNGEKMFYACFVRANW